MTITEIISEVIAEHFAIESGLKKIAVFSEENGQEIRLIEVNEEALPTDRSNLLCSHLGRNWRFPYILPM